MLPVLLASLAAAVPTADCSQHVEGPPISAETRAAALRQSVRVHGATFFGLRRARTADFEGKRANPVIKSGLSVRAGAPMRIKVAARDRDWLALDYDRTDKSGEGAPMVRVVPCAPDTPRFSDDGVVGDETGWAGGFVVRRNGCATLLLRREGEERWRTARVAFGARCR
ncbi:hypothetical protein OM076_26730 [Solirubrobacter ginsenosidimutans]|uniref:Uncharacterized protein n=1 Tax=Solirubrobacter ginsenosidimutans TaxID=490573 RepID=A0A9X3MZ15_9ACTN|nr:hypothetical protein [Solirubrobacter ginsenosidimutans]MDA0163895.1 hypothetical protein [Solirubrobacter ginsenosidimutans]